MRREIPPEPEIVDAPESERVSFPCKNCGAKMTWDPESDALGCDYCGARVQVPRAEGTILERPLAEAASVARGLGLARRVARCQNCGAQVSYDEASTAETCVYCGSANVLSQEANRNAIRPESLLPLDVGRHEVERHFRAWLHGLWFRPDALKRTKGFHAIGVYVPFWTFDCAVDSSWSADAGHYYWTTQVVMVMVNGKPTMQTRRVQKIRWVPAWGDRKDVYDDLLVNCSGSVPGGLVRKLGGFDTKALVPYRPEYLAGWRAEEYQVDLERGWQHAQQEIEARQRARCAGDVPGDTHRDLRVQNRIDDVRWKHVLLPMWSLQYRFGGKPYTVLVNGQSGLVVGDAPYSWVKILLLIAAIGAVVLLVVLFVAAGSAFS